MEFICFCVIGLIYFFMNWNVNKMVCIINGGLFLVYMNCNCFIFLIFVEFGVGYGVVVLICFKGLGWVFV